MEPTPRNSPDKRHSCSQNWSNTFLILRLHTLRTHTHAHTRTAPRFVLSCCYYSSTLGASMPEDLWEESLCSQYCLLPFGSWAVKNRIISTVPSCSGKLLLAMPFLAFTVYQTLRHRWQSEEYREVYIWPGGFLKAGKQSFILLHALKCFSSC